MDKRTTASSLSSSSTCEGLHEWLRGKIQERIQELREAEVIELLGRVRYQRWAVVNGPPANETATVSSGS